MAGPLAAAPRSPGCLCSGTGLSKERWSQAAQAAKPRRFPWSPGGADAARGARDRGGGRAPGSPRNRKSGPWVRFGGRSRGPEGGRGGHERWDPGGRRPGPRPRPSCWLPVPGCRGTWGRPPSGQGAPFSPPRRGLPSASWPGIPLPRCCPGRFVCSLGPRPRPLDGPGLGVGSGLQLPASTTQTPGQAASEKPLSPTPQPVWTWLSWQSLEKGADVQTCDINGAALHTLYKISAA